MSVHCTGRYIRSCRNVSFFKSLVLTFLSPYISFVRRRQYRSHGAAQRPIFLFGASLPAPPAPSSSSSRDAAAHAAEKGPPPQLPLPLPLSLPQLQFKGDHPPEETLCIFSGIKSDQTGKRFSLNFLSNHVHVECKWSNHVHVKCKWQTGSLL